MSTTRVYLDMNIFEKMIKQNMNMALLEKIKETVDVEYYISVGHAEEVYIAKVSDVKGEYEDENLARRRLVEELSVKGVLNPTNTRIRNKFEKFADAYQRVETCDTRDIIKKIGEINSKIQNEKVKEHQNNNSDVKNYSRLSAKEIWEMPEVKKELENVRKRINDSNNMLRHNIFHEMFAWGYRFDVAAKIVKAGKIDSDFVPEYNCFNKICDKFSLLEFSIEFLHEVLNKSGYNRDKGAKVISGIYDTTHSIYATYCDFLVTDDGRFQKRTNAIYYYLGVPTKVINFEEFLSWCYSEI